MRRNYPMVRPNTGQRMASNVAWGIPSFSLGWALEKSCRCRNEYAKQGDSLCMLPESKLGFSQGFPREAIPFGI
jgi:hypothetical protein